MYRDVADSELVAYQPLVKSLAKKYVGRSGAEWDDLYQEGMISVWEALRRKNIPSSEVVTYAMLQWVRFLRRLTKGDHASTTVPASMDENVLGKEGT